MKINKFNEVFLLVAIIIFVGAKGNVWSSILLILAAIWMMIDVIPKLWKELRNAKRGTKRTDKSN